MIIEGSITVPESYALRRFRLEERVTRYALGALSGPDETVCVSAGNLRIEGDLDLGHLGHAGLIVEGHLEVTGSIIDAHQVSCCGRTYENDGIPFLLVAGNLHARNVVVGDSQMCVEGNAEIDELLLLHDFESKLRIAGTTQAAMILDTYENRPGFPLSDYLHHDIPIELDDEREPITVERVDSDVLIARIRAGLPVLRDPDDPRPRKSYAAWFADCEKFGEALALVPRDWIDSAISFAAVRNDGLAIAHVPRELVTEELVDAALARDPYALQGVPAEFHTPERCRMAVQHSAHMLRHVPVELRTPELCTLAVSRTSRVFQIIEYVPEEHLTPELCLLAAQRDGLCIGGMPERVRTFEVCVAAVREHWGAKEYVPEAIRDAVTKATMGIPAAVPLQDRHPD